MLKPGAFLSDAELKDVGQASMKLSFENSALDFLGDDWLTIRDVLFEP